MSNTFKGLVVIFTLILYPTVLQAEEQPNAIVIEAEAWSRATEADGTGLYWDLIRKVYEPEGITVKTNTSTYSRSIGLMKTGEVDAMVGAYADEVTGALYANHHFDADVVAALFRKGEIAWQGESSLKDKHIAAIKGYKLDEYITVPFKIHEYRDRGVIIKLLNEGKVDVFVDALMDIQEELKKNNVSKDRFETGIVKQLKLYIVFADNKRGKYLRDLFDQRFKVLLENGDIKRMFDQWNWPIFPF